jgi:uncharacterized membrane protein YqiK
MKKTEMAETIEAQRVKIEAQAEIIRRMSGEIAALEGDKYRLTHSISEIDKYFTETMKNIALEIITHGTHRERDLYYKRQVLGMVTMQEVFIDSAQVTDGIPF